MPGIGTAADPRLHDFRNAAPLSAERDAAVRAFQADFSGEVRSIFTRQVREVIDADPGPVHLLAPDDATTRFAVHAIRYRLMLGDPRNSTAIIELAPGIAGRVMDRLCGGADEPSKADRPITGIEQSLLGELLGRVMAPLATALRDITPCKPASLHFVPTVDCAWMAGPGEHIAICCFTMSAGPMSGEMALALPLAVFASAAATGPKATEEPREEVRARIEQQLLAAEVPLAVRVGFPIGALDIASLNVGTVLPTGHSAHGTVDVTVAGRRRFIGMLGREQDHVAVRLLRDAVEEENNSRSTRRNSAP